MSFDRFRLSSATPKEDIKPFAVIKPGGCYELTFRNFDEFEVWRRQEEKANAIEFVKLDARRSNAVRRPRYKEHVKLVCDPRLRDNARHPERTRDLSGRKVDSLGCRASISYKTSVYSDTVRVVYNRDHSHPYGPKGLPSIYPGLGTPTVDTTLSKVQPTTPIATTSNEKQSLSRTTSPLLQAPALLMNPSSPGSSTCPTPPSLSPLFDECIVCFSDAQDNYLADIGLNFDQNCGQIYDSMDPKDYQSQQPQGSSSGNNLVHTPTPQMVPSPLTCHSPSQATEVPEMDKSHERWARLAMLFDSVHTQALAFDYPEGSVDTLEIALLSLHLGSPIPESPVPGRVGSQVEITGAGQIGDHRLGDDMEEFVRIDEILDCSNEADHGYEPLVEPQYNSLPLAPVYQL